MALRTDDRQWLIYDPNTVDFAFRVLTSAALVSFGAALQARARRMPSAIKDNLGIIGSSLWKFGDAGQDINAGLAPNKVHDTLVGAARSWDKFNRWLEDPSSVPFDEVVDVVDQMAAAMAHMDETTQRTGTNHPRWNSRLVSGQPCESCGR